MVEEMLRRMRNDEQNALTAIYMQYWEELYLTANSILKDENDAEDTIHDIFVRVWNRRKTLEIETSLKNYLHSAVRYECYHKLRKKSKLPTLPLEEGDQTCWVTIDCPMELQELNTQINDILHSMSPKSQYIFKMSREENMSYNDIAKATKLSLKSIEYHISKVLKKLKNVLTLPVFIVLIEWFYQYI